MAQQTLQSFNYCLPITTSDTVEMPTFPAGGTSAGGRHPDMLWVGGAGVVVAVFDDGSTASFTVLAGTLLPIRCKRVNATNTTATLIVGCWQL